MAKIEDKLLNKVTKNPLIFDFIANKQIVVWLKQKRVWPIQIPISPICKGIFLKKL